MSRHCLGSAMKWGNCGTAPCSDVARRPAFEVGAHGATHQTLATPRPNLSSRSTDEATAFGVLTRDKSCQCSPLIASDLFTTICHLQSWLGRSMLRLAERQVVAAGDNSFPAW